MSNISTENTPPTMKDKILAGGLPKYHDKMHNKASYLYVSVLNYYWMMVFNQRMDSMRTV